MAIVLWLPNNSKNSNSLEGFGISIDTSTLFSLETNSSKPLPSSSVSNIEYFVLTQQLSTFIRSYVRTTNHSVISLCSMYDRFERGFDGRSGYYGDYGYPAGYSAGYGPSRYEPYPPRMVDRRLPERPGVRGGHKGPQPPIGSQRPPASRQGGPGVNKKGTRRPSGKRTSAVQFTASRSRDKAPFVISQSKWGNSNRSSWIFPRFGDYIDTEDTPIWLTPDDLTTKFEVPADNQYCPDCGKYLLTRFLRVSISS